MLILSTPVSHLVQVSDGFLKSTYPALQNNATSQIGLIDNAENIIDKSLLLKYCHVRVWFQENSRFLETWFNTAPRAIVLFYHDFKISVKSFCVSFCNQQEGFSNKNNSHLSSQTRTVIK